MIFVVNSLGSKRSAQHWRKVSASFKSAFPKADVLEVEGRNLAGLEFYTEDKVLIFVGDDRFFSTAVNRLFGKLSEVSGDKVIAFLPDSKENALAGGLSMPYAVDEQIKLIQSKRNIPFDICRCHYIGPDGNPTKSLILNDALIRVPRVKLPLLARTVVQWVKSRVGPERNSSSRVSIFVNREKVYDGDYLCSILLLGNYLTGGTKIRNRPRFMLSKFEYVQLNACDIKDYTAVLPWLFQLRGEHPNVFQGKFNEIEVRGLGEQNQIVADGNLIGRLPASFTLLPKAFNVISPIQTIKAVKPHKVKSGLQEVPAIKPISQSY